MIVEQLLIKKNKNCTINILHYNEINNKQFEVSWTLHNHSLTILYNFHSPTPRFNAVKNEMVLEKKENLYSIIHLYFVYAFAVANFKLWKSNYQK